MRYTYAYKTSNGTRHEAAKEAESREAVFEQLRAQGIKAIKVVAADGSKANGEVRGVRKRVVYLVVVVLLLAALFAAFLAFRVGETKSNNPTILPPPRVWICRHIDGTISLVLNKPEKGVAPKVVFTNNPKVNRS